MLDRPMAATTTPALPAAASAGPPIACPDCDLLQRLPPLAAGDRARCPRCGCVVARRPRHGHDTPLALTVTAAIAFVVAQTTPLMGLSAVGRKASTTIVGGSIAMWQQGEPVTAALVLFCAFVAPAAFIAATLALLLGARCDPVPRWCGDLLRLAAEVQPWAMFEVMLLGILVALIKIAELATVDAGIGMWAMALLALLFPAMVVSIDARAIWERIGIDAGGAGQR